MEGQREGYRPLCALASQVTRRNIYLNSQSRILVALCCRIFVAASSDFYSDKTFFTRVQRQRLRRRTAAQLESQSHTKKKSTQSLK